jgi:hypothetical protein
MDGRMKDAWTFATVLLAATAVRAQPPAGTVRVTTADGARIVEVEVPGAVLGAAAASGGRLAILTAAEAEAPRTVYLLDPGGEAGLTATAAELPAASHAVAALPSGEVAVGEPGRIHSLGPVAAGPAREIVESPHLDLPYLHRRGLLRTAGIYQPQVGRLRVFSPGEHGTWTAADEIALPVEVRRERRGLRLESPPVAVLERPGGSPLVLAGPVARGSTRLLTTWIDAETRACDDEDCEQRRQRWTRLPSPEAVTDSFYVDVDGRATLVVATVGADQVGIFERKQLRVFPLWTDRTRAGAAATLKAETTSRRWQEVAVEVLDLDGDGHDDLAVLQRQGLGGKDVVVEVFQGTGNGGFYVTSRKSEVTAPDAAWRYGRDVDGDGRADLVTLSDGRLSVFAGVDHKRRVVDKQPLWTVEPPAGSGGRALVLVDEESDASPTDAKELGGLELVDLGGDGRWEIVLWSSADGRGWLRVVGQNR